MTFNASTGVLSGTPAAGTGGTYALSFTAANGVGQPASQSFTLTVDQARQSPAPATRRSRSAVPGSFTLTASGFPAADSQRVGRCRAGVTFNASTGVLSGTPARRTGGTYNLTFTAANGVGAPASAEASHSRSTRPGDHQRSMRPSRVGNAGSFIVTASGFPAPALSESGTLPAGVTFNASTGVLSGTPAAGTDGTYNLTFTASNGVGATGQRRASP